MKKLTRRDFMTASSAAAAGVCICSMGGCLPLGRQGNTPEIKPQAFKIEETDSKIDIIIEINEIPELMKEGKAYKIINAQLNDSLIIANTGGDQFVATSISCTHNSFEVEYQHDNKRFRCISINHAEFALDGKVIGHTSTTKALKTYPIHRQSDKLILNFA